MLYFSLRSLLIHTQCVHALFRCQRTASNVNAHNGSDSYFGLPFFSVGVRRYFFGSLRLILVLSLQPFPPSQKALPLASLTRARPHLQVSLLAGCSREQKPHMIDLALYRRCSL